jgi:hypothetical protein
MLGWSLAEPKAGILTAVVPVSIHEEFTYLLLRPVYLLDITTVQKIVFQFEISEYEKYRSNMISTILYTSHIQLLQVK